MDLGQHATFIWASYGIFVVVLAALILWLMADGKRQTRALADLEARGVKRGAQRTPSDGTKA
jgi:heme exporter protein D